MKNFIEVTVVLEIGKVTEYRKSLFPISATMIQDYKKGHDYKDVCKLKFQGEYFIVTESYDEIKKQIESEVL